MARIFSIAFLHSGVEYSAMISVRQNAFHTEFEISMLEDELTGHLPANRIITSLPDQYIFPNISSELYTPLMKEIIQAIDLHMHASIGSPSLTLP